MLPLLTLNLSVSPFQFQRVGCDKVIGSSAKLDRCGVCNGDGRTCTFGNSSVEALKKTLVDKYKEQGHTFKNTFSLLKKLGYKLPQNDASVDTNDIISEFYWAVIRTGCSATCGGGEMTLCLEINP